MTRLEALEAFSKKTVNVCDLAEPFGRVQLNLYLQQILTYNLWQSVAFLLLWIGTGTVVICKSRKLYGYSEDRTIRMYAALLAVIGHWIIIIACAVNIPNIAKITVAPKIFITEYLKGDLK